jgi:ATP-dependent Clp protease ATP-binding subunit ClpC
LLDEAGAIAHLTHAAENEDDYGDDDNFPIVDEHTISMVISEWAAIPLGKLESSEMDRLVQLEEDMTQRIKGQGRAIQSVARAVRRARSGLRDPKRPIASFMFCGPTGTGKSCREKNVNGFFALGRLNSLTSFLQAKPSFVRHWRKPTLDRKKI